MVEVMVNSWMVQEFERLAGLAAHSELLASDLASCLVGYLNEEQHLALRLAGKPDHSERRRKAPDHVYIDEQGGLRLVFEVTQPMSAALRRSEEQLKSFVGMVGRQLPADLKGAYALLCVGAGGDPWVPPKGHQRRQQLADQMARKITSGYKALPPIDDDRPAPIRQAELVSPPFAQWVARQAIDMRELLPAGEAVFAVRFDDAREPAFLTAVWLPHRREPEEFQNDYRKLVREANAKVEWLKETGYESFLLLDNRWNRELGSQDPSDLREWHGLPARFPDAPAFDPELEASDFDAIDHILFFSVGSQGLRVETIWRSPDAHVVTPDSWVIKPSGWYDD